MSYRIVDIEPNSPEHFEFRKGKIGASHAPAIMGCGFQTAASLWDEMVFNKDKPKTASMARGIDLEPKARVWASEHNGIDFRPVITQSVEYPWRIASLDCYALVDGNPYILEIKCPGERDHAIALKREVPKHYMPQLQHQMDVLGVSSMIYLSFDGERGQEVIVKKDEEYCKRLFQAEQEFYNSIIDHRRPDEDWIAITNESTLELANKRIECYNRIKKLEAELEEFDDQLTQSLTNEKNVIGDLKIWRETRPGSVDYKKIEKDYSINLDAYRKNPSTYWKMRS